MAVTPPDANLQSRGDTPRRRVPAAERREQVIAAAREVVARDGMQSCSTAEVARRAGISHAYLFRLFPTKEDLLVALTRDSCGAVRDAMMVAAGAARTRGEDPLAAMGHCWVELLEDDEKLQLCLQSIGAAASLPAVGAAAREEWGVMIDSLRRAAPDALTDELRNFLATGMLLMVIAGLQAGDDPWVAQLFGGPLPCGTDSLRTDASRKDERSGDAGN